MNLLLLLLLLLVVAFLHVGASASECSSSNSNSEVAEKKRFVYLVQAPDESEVGDLRRLVSEESDVIVLYWRSRPSVLSDHEVFHPNCTLNAGRNRLLQVARDRRDRNYLYFIMMDHDAVVVELRDYGLNTGNAFRTLETYLRVWQPAVGVVSYQGQDFNETMEVMVLYGFDGVLNAYHREVVDFLLPYTEHFDDESWWYSMFLVNTLCAAYFNEHRLQFNALHVLPGSSIGHLAYPSNINYMRPFDWILPAITDVSALTSLRYNPHDENFRIALKGEPKMYPGNYTIHPSRYASCHPYFFRKYTRLTPPRNAAITHPCDGVKFESQHATAIDVHFDLPLKLPEDVNVSVSVHGDMGQEWTVEVARDKIDVSRHRMMAVRLPPLQVGTHTVELLLQNTRKTQKEEIRIIVADWVKEQHPQPTVVFIKPSQPYEEMKPFNASGAEPGGFAIEYVIANWKMPEQGSYDILLNDEVMMHRSFNKETSFIMYNQFPGINSVTFRFFDTNDQQVGEEIVFPFVIPDGY